MRWVLLFFALLWGGGAQAQSLDVPRGAVPIVAAAYVGPGDVIGSASMFWSCARAYNAAYATSNGKLCNIRRTSDGHTCDLLAATTGAPGVIGNCSTGGDNGSTLTTWLNATTGFVVTAYDQTAGGNCGGSCDVTQATSANQPQILTSGCATVTGGAYCMKFTAASSMQLISTGSAAISQASGISEEVVAEATSSASVYGVLVADTTNNLGMYFHLTGANLLGLFINGGSFSQTATDAAAHAGVGAVTAAGTSSVMNVDGSENTGTLGTLGFNGHAVLGSFNGGDYLDGQISEAGVWVGTWSAGQRTSMCHNPTVYYGTGGSC